MENGLKGLILAGATIVTCMVITLGFFIAKEARNTANESAGQISMLTGEFTEGNLSVYDGIIINGSEILNVIRKTQGQNVAIEVVGGALNASFNGSCSSSYETYSPTIVTDISKATDASSSSTYIPPNSRFRGQVCSNSKGTIMAIRFTKM
ncbi:MAG: hypothetical protein K6G65_02505 [Lachnospiraceae bacterium]|nr:hypothetical protein [Lachnospiraceae bacterium]